jgi:hypothetical protein
MSMQFGAAAVQFEPRQFAKEENIFRSLGPFLRSDKQRCLLPSFQTHSGVPAMTSPEAYPTIPDLAGKVILITGASTGIGAAAAVAFGHNKARVAIHYNARLERPAGRRS